MIKKSFGFTIVELLVVIVVIGILAAITLVSYTGVTSRAKIAVMQSDLSNSSKRLKIYQATYGSYPTIDSTTKCPTAPTADNTLCLKASSGNTFTYSSNGTTFALTSTNTNGTAYGINDTSSPVALAQPTDCPTGFIPVPGSATYGTAGFCVMKYEAKADANSDGIGDTDYTTGYNTYPADTRPISASIKLVSSAAGYPVARIIQTTAIAAASNASFVTGCPSGCHLITEAEWLTIAQNVLSVPSNWNGGVVGTSYIYSGHNDNVPATALVADASDTNNYSGTGQTSPSNQRRTLTLTNGEVIWDLAGNLWEWTSGQTNGSTAQQPGIATAGYAWREWNAATTTGTLPVNPFPAFGTPAASAWDATTNGIGRLYSSSDDTALHGFLRGGDWYSYDFAGVLTFDSSFGPGIMYSSVGFRVAR